MSDKLAKDKVSDKMEAALRSLFPVLDSHIELPSRTINQKGNHLSCWLLRDGSLVHASGSNHDDSAAQVLKQCGAKNHADAALELMRLTGAIRLRLHSTEFVQAILVMAPTLQQMAIVAIIALQLNAGGGTLLYEVVSADGMQTLTEGSSIVELIAEDWNSLL